MDKVMRELKVVRNNAQVEEGGSNNNSDNEEPNSLLRRRTKSPTKRVTIAEKRKAMMKYNTLNNLHTDGNHLNEPAINDLWNMVLFEIKTLRDHYMEEVCNGARKEVNH